MGDACVDYASTPDLSEDAAEAEVFDFNEDMWSTYDVLEPILMLVAVKLYKFNRLRLLLPRPDVTTLVTVSSVCRDWWDVIKGRKFIRRRLKLTFRESTVLPVELFKAAVLKRHRLLDVPHETSRDADVLVVQSLASVCRHWKAAFSESGDLRRQKLKRHHPQLLVTLDEPPTYIEGRPRWVVGFATLNNCLYVAYSQYNKVEVFDCENNCKKIKDIEVEDMMSPVAMVGSSVMSQLFISDWFEDAIWRVDLRTRVSDVFIKTDHMLTNLSLVENRLLVASRDSLLIYDILSGEEMMRIALPDDIKRHFVKLAFESTRGSFLMCHGEPFGNIIVSEIDLNGQVIRLLDNTQLRCRHLTLNSIDHMFVGDWRNKRVVLFDRFFDRNLKCERTLIDSRRLDNGRPSTLHYFSSKKRLTIGLDNGKVKIFEY